jgi:hypothetical protein
MPSATYGGGQSAGAVAAYFRYIDRKGELDIETDEGIALVARGSSVSCLTIGAFEEQQVSSTVLHHSYLHAHISGTPPGRTRLSNAVHMASAQVLSIVPRAAALYDQRMSRGLDGDPQASTDARLILKDLIPNRIRLSPKADGTLWARFDLHPAALFSIAGERGRGDAICRVPGVPLDARLR